MSVFPAWFDLLPTLSNGFKWDPGIPGGIPAGTQYGATLTAPTAASINTALNNASSYAASLIAGGTAPRDAIQVVQVGPGDFGRWATDITPQSYTVLRGNGPWGAARTRIRLGANNCITSGDFGSWGAAQNITGPFTSGVLPMGSTSCTVASSATFLQGDIVCLDELIDLTKVWPYDHLYHQRDPNDANQGPVSPGGLRCVRSLHLVTSVVGTTVNFYPPSRWPYNASLDPEIWRASRPGSNGIFWSGVEDLCTTGTHNDPGPVHFGSGAYCWVKDVEIDGSTTTGLGTSADKILLVNQFRAEVRRGYVHHSDYNGGYIYGGANYLVNLNDNSSDCLVVDSIICNGNKLLQMNGAGPGNVLAYNYVDNASADAGGSGWMDGAINLTHSSHPFACLVEGNATANMGGDTTHGTASHNVLFRNWSFGCSTFGNSNNLRAVNADAWQRELAVVGNVLMSPGATPRYEFQGQMLGGNWAIYSVGQCGMGSSDFWDDQVSRPWPNEGSIGFVPQSTYTTKAKDVLHRHRNFYKVNGTTGAIDNQSGFADTFLPDSLFLAARPAFFGNNPWPPVDPYTATVAAPIGTRVIPAKARFDAGTPFAAPGASTQRTTTTVASGQVLSLIQTRTQTATSSGFVQQVSISVTSPGPGETVNLPFQATGFATPGSTVTCYNDGNSQVLGTATAAAGTGYWTMTISSTGA